MSKINVKEPVVEKTVDTGKRDPFGCPVILHVYGVRSDDVDHFIDTYGVKPFDGDPSNTEAVIIKRERISDVVQSYSQELGFQALLKKASRGLVNPASWADDGNRCGRDDLVPEYAGDLEKEAAKLKAQRLQALRSMGISDDVTLENFEQVLKDYVASEVAKQSQPKKEGE